MRMSLIEQFIKEDFSESANNEILKECESLIGKDISREYTFNRFNLKIDFGSNKVVLDDDLDCDESGQAIIELQEFIKLIKENEDLPS